MRLQDKIIVVTGSTNGIGQAIARRIVQEGAAVYWPGDESRPINGSVVEQEQYSLIGRNPPKG